MIIKVSFIWLRTACINLTTSVLNLVPVLHSTRQHQFRQGSTCQVFWTQLNQPQLRLKRLRQNKCLPQYQFWIWPDSTNSDARGRGVGGGGGGGGQQGTNEVYVNLKVKNKENFMILKKCRTINEWEVPGTNPHLWLLQYLWHSKIVASVKADRAMHLLLAVSTDEWTDLIPN